MDIEGARRVMETTCHDTANQYLRFGWKLINQHIIPATEDSPSKVNYVLASLRSIEDTRQLVTETDWQTVNRYLALGWKLVDKYVTSSTDEVRRHELLHFVLAWQREEDPVYPGDEAESEPSSSDLFDLDL